MNGRRRFKLKLTDSLQIVPPALLEIQSNEFVIFRVKVAVVPYRIISTEVSVTYWLVKRPQHINRPEIGRLGSG